MLLQHVYDIVHGRPGKDGAQKPKIRGTRKATSPEVAHNKLEYVRRRSAAGTINSRTKNCESEGDRTLATSVTLT
jgi:hypothetical protein